MRGLAQPSPDPAASATAARVWDSGRVLVVDDEPAQREGTAAWLGAAGHTVHGAACGAEALQAAANEPDVVLLDYGLPDIDGFEVLRQLVARKPLVPVIMVTGQASVGHAVEAMKLGAFDYIVKPVDFDRLEQVVGRAVTVAHARRDAGPDALGDDDMSAIVGGSPPIIQLRALIGKLARCGDVTVLVTGESGSGKDLVARAIHGCSPRSAHAFVNVTCTALPTNLLESELFGHERGAFTDAKARHVGLLEQARGGTLFLDEIGDMELSLQGKLLRVLEDKRFRRVGGSADIEADVRIVAATHADLTARVAAGTFREDLYYRLAVLLVHVPPLRERSEDIELLAHTFLARSAKLVGRPGLQLSVGALRKLGDYDWPGNVRELRNAIERAAVLTESASIGPADIQVTSGAARPVAIHQLPAGGLDFAALERELVVQALERTHGNATQAARLLGMNRDQIRYRVHKYRLADAGD